MASPMRTSQSGIELIKSFEGFRARAARLPDGSYLIGYGHTRAARAGLTVSEFDADLVLRHADLPPVERLITSLVLTPVNQNEFDALVSFAWNVGEPAFAASDVLAELNTGDRLGAASAMLAWRRGRVDGQLRVIDALVRRRVAEMALFLDHPSGRAAVPGALLRPQREAASAPGPRETGITIAPREDLARPAGRGRPAEDSPRAAARAVGVRIDRILAEGGPDNGLPAASGTLPDAKGDGLSIEEITRAISALADPDPGAGSPDPAGLRGPPEGVERRRAGPRPMAALGDIGDAALPHADDTVVDDLATVTIDPESVSRAGRENGAHAAPFAFGKAIRWLPFALLAGLGLVGVIAGIQSFLAQAVRIARSEMDVLAGPLLLFGGAVLLVTSSYYLYRALTRID